MDHESFVNRYNQFNYILFIKNRVRSLISEFDTNAVLNTSIDLTPLSVHSPVTSYHTICIISIHVSPNPCVSSWRTPPTTTRPVTSYRFSIRSLCLPTKNRNENLSRSSPSRDSFPLDGPGTEEVKVFSYRWLQRGKIPTVMRWNQDVRGDDDIKDSRRYRVPTCFLLFLSQSTMKSGTSSGNRYGEYHCW